MEPSISVIMSVYNETQSEIRQSIYSVLNQTYKNFECIIIVDNPQRTDIINYLTDLAKNDARLIIQTNANNIGLAMSMNKAAQISRGKYLARMDSDDICIETRLQKQYECMESNGWDLTCTNYEFIDEDDKKLDMVANHVSDENLRKHLPFGSFIHHPTVMIKKEIFEEVGGYRNFPCSQDYDLWLRLFEKKIKMHYIDEILLQYRIRSSGISQSNKVRQLNTIWYIQRLYYERKSKGYDSYSLESYNDYLKRENVFNEKYCKKAQSDKLIKDKIDLYRSKKNKTFFRLFLMIYLFFFSSFYHKYYIHLFINKIGIHLS